MVENSFLSMSGGGVVVVRKLSHNYSPPLTVREREIYIYIIYIVFPSLGKFSNFLDFFPMRETGKFFGFFPLRERKIFDIFPTKEKEILRLFPFISFQHFLHQSKILHVLSGGFLQSFLLHPYILPVLLL